MIAAPLAVISGATGGIGRVVTERLWQEGYSILALGKTPAKCLALQDWFVDHARPGQQEYVTAIDLTRPQEYSLLTRILEEHLGDCRLLVTCHGAPPCIKPTLELTMEDIERVWQTDVVATLRLCQVIGPAMLHQRQGAIVLVSSMHSRQTYPQRTLYSMCKSGIGGLVRSLSLEWGPAGITVNALCPWQVEGARTQEFLDAAAGMGEDLRAQYEARVPLRRLIDPTDMSEAILFLSRTRAITGQELLIDCGLTASGWYKPFQPFRFEG